MKKNVFVSFFVISMMTLGVLACSSDSDNVGADGIETTEPFATAEIDTLSLDLLPKWIAEKVKKMRNLVIFITRFPSTNVCGMGIFITSFLTP